MVRCFLFAALCAAFLETGTARAAALYSEEFANATSGDLSLSAFGWAAAYSASATAVDPASLDRTAAPVISNSAGFGGANGSLLVYKNTSYATGAPLLIYTTEIASFAVDVSGVGDISFEWDNLLGLTGLRLALEIGNAWYASAAQSAQGFVDAYHLIDVNLASTSWYALAFAPGNTLSADTSAPVALPASGTIQGIGFYDATWSSPGQFVKLDALSVNPVPEPPAWACLGLGLAAFTAVAWSRAGGNNPVASKDI